jgi:hypothetical protein
MGDTVTIDTATLAAAVVGTAYSETLAASAGTAPYAWTNPLGVLPQGLTLSAAGVIAGTPTRAEIRSFAVRATDDDGETGERVLSIVVTDPAGITPTGMISLPLYYLQKTVAASANFQRVTGAADAAEALDYVYLISEESAVAVGPWAVIGIEKGFARTSGATGPMFTGSVNLELVIRLPVAAGATEQEANISFLNDLGAIAKDIEGLLQTAGYLDSHSMVIKDGPARPMPTEESTVGKYREAVYAIRANLGV